MILRDIHTKSWYGHDGVLDDTVILSCLISNVHFNCIVQDSLYHNKVPRDIVHWSAAPHHSL